MKVEAKQESGLAGRVLRGYGHAVRAFVAGEYGSRAIAAGVLLLVLLLTINGLNVLNSYVGRDFMTAIEQRDAPGFVRMALLYAGVFALLTAAAVIYRFTEERFGLLWREWLTLQFVDVYLRDHVYYRLSVSEALTNPDQRIADDVRLFTTTTLSIALLSLNGLFTIVAFAGVLWSISRVLFAAAVGYAALGSVLAIVFGRSLIPLNYFQSDAEADFRADLVRVRQNAELVALLHREPHLGNRLRRDLTALTLNLKRIIAVNRNLGFFTTGYSYFIQLIPVLVVAPLFMRGEAEFGVISQSAMAFAHLVGAFSLVVNQFPQLSSYAAVGARLSVLDSATVSATTTEAGVAIVEDGSRFSFEGVTLRSAEDGSLLVRDLSFEVPPGAHVVIRVPSHAIETALQRAVAGIWTHGEGRIVRPPLGRVLLIPERPYLPPGTLRELLVSVDHPTGATDEEIYDVLASLGGEDAVQRVRHAGGLDIASNWGDLLSLEEQRLIDVARIILAAPRFAVLADMDEGLAQHVLALLASHGIGSVELREQWPDVWPAELLTLEISADGSWKPLTRTARGPQRAV
jgi:putative ATP-binding cassette transporter